MVPDQRVTGNVAILLDQGVICNVLSCFYHTVIATMSVITLRKLRPLNIEGMKAFWS